MLWLKSVYLLIKLNIKPNADQQTGTRRINTMGAAAREVEVGRGNEEAEIATENGGLAETDTETAKIADKDEGTFKVLQFYALGHIPLMIDEAE